MAASVSAGCVACAGDGPFVQRVHAAGAGGRESAGEIHRDRGDIELRPQRGLLLEPPHQRGHRDDVDAVDFSGWAECVRLLVGETKDWRHGPANGPRYFCGYALDLARLAVLDCALRSGR